MRNAFFLICGLGLQATVSAATANAVVTKAVVNARGGSERKTMAEAKEERALNVRAEAILPNERRIDFRPKTFFATDPPQAACSQNPLQFFSVYLGMEPEELGNALGTLLAKLAKELGISLPLSASPLPEAPPPPTSGLLKTEEEVPEDGLRRVFADLAETLNRLGSKSMAELADEAAAEKPGPGVAAQLRPLEKALARAQTTVSTFATAVGAVKAVNEAKSAADNAGNNGLGKDEDEGWLFGVLKQLVPNDSKDSSPSKSTTSAAPGPDYLRSLRSMVKLMKADDPVNLSRDLPELLVAFMTAKPAANFLGDLLAQGPRLTFDPSMATPFISLRSLMKNMGQAACDGIARSSYTDFDPRWATCGLVSLFSLALACAKSSPTCNLALNPLEQMDLHKCAAPVVGRRLALTADSRTLPDGEELDYLATVTDDLGQQVSVLKAEGHVYLKDWYASAKWAAYSHSEASCENKVSVFEELIPGFKRVREFWSFTEGTPGLAGMPTVVLSQPVPTESKAGKKADSQCLYHLTFRGTITNWEWLTNFSAHQYSHLLRSWNDMENGAGEGKTVLLHHGFLAYMLPFLDQFRNYVSESDEFAACLDSGELVFHLTGHSQGGGLATLVSVLLADEYPQATVELVAFAPARSLGIDAYRFLRKYVNARSIVNELDLIPNLPCTNERMDKDPAELPSCAFPELGKEVCDLHYPFVDNSRKGLYRCDSRIGAVLQGEGIDEAFAPHPHTYLISRKWLGNFKFDLPPTPGSPTPTKYDSALIFDEDRLLDIFVGDIMQGEIKLELHTPSTINVGANHICAYACFATANFCFPDKPEYTRGCYCDQGIAGPIQDYPDQPPEGSDNY